MRVQALCLVVGIGLATSTFVQAQSPDPCPNPQPVPAELTLPASLPPGDPVAFEQQVLAYLSTYKYRALDWCVDKGVRDTGPFIGGTSYGTHGAVRVYYSPQVIKWLRGDRQGPIDDGAVIIKEQYGGSAPAAKVAGLDDTKLRPTDWTFMIRKAAASKDGWFWGEVWTTPPMTSGPTQYPAAGFDLYCLRCHASAAREFTYSSLQNIKGYAGYPLTFRVDDSWRKAAPQPGQAAQPPADAQHARNKLPALKSPPAAVAALAAPDAARAALLRFTPPRESDVQRFPPEPLDHYGSTAVGVPQFVTSDNCLGCHGAASGLPFGPSMWIAQGPGIDVSPYGEWRWSPMGLAGRDPIFFAQLESELANLPPSFPPQKVVDTCMQCHGAMGKRTYAAQHEGQPFKLDFVFESNPAAPGFRYGGLARDGISCTVCHHVADQLQGPFRDDEIVTDSMKNATGAKPVYAAHMRSSRMCGGCHTIELPVVDGLPGQTSVEQNTYVEWLNSQYQNEFGPPNPRARTCQDCHMKGSYRSDALGINVPQIQSRIAIIQDLSYPATEGMLPPDQVNVRYRESGYRRHELLGLNAFLLQMFSQFSDVLGVRTSDYMSGSTNNLQATIGNIVQQAQSDTASLSVSATASGGSLTAAVAVTNLAGHKFPSGVGFRRAFLEFQVIDTRGSGAVVFASGRTDSNGVIVGADGQPLATEFFAPAAGGGQQYQPHFDERNPITRADQVQIYEELVQDAKGAFTTSFIRRDKVVKDNRLLPIGWTAQGPVPGLTPKFLEATHPEGTGNDPSYQNGQGTSRVRYQVSLPPGTDPSKLRVVVTLNHQSIPPYYLRDRFQAADGPATRRLAHISGRLNLAGTALENWKLKITSAQIDVK